MPIASISKLNSAKMRYPIFFAVLVFVCLAPVWSVAYFVNQDGSAHVHTAYLMSELLKGNQSFSEFYAFNSLAIPNSSGHWLMVVLIQVFSPFLITKIMASVTFAGFVLAVGLLRYKTAGGESIGTSLLIGAALGFNWMWLVGFYNFDIGLIVMLAGLAFHWRRRSSFSVWDALIFCLLLLLAYFSHIVPFAALLGGAFIFSIFGNRDRRWRTLFLTILAAVPTIPLVILFKSLGGGGERFSPVWRNLDNPFSPVAWVRQLRVVDSFIIISRKSFPFVSQDSGLFAIFTPSLWIAAAFLLLLVASYTAYRRDRELLRRNVPFLLLSAGSILVALFGPDDFNLENGGAIRERLFLIGLLFLVPLFRTPFAHVKRAAQASLVVVIAFQTLALWEYAITANLQAGEFFAAADTFDAGESRAMIVIEKGPPRFVSQPMAQIDCYMGIGRSNIIWDNYELGLYFFPVVTQRREDYLSIRALTSSQLFLLPSGEATIDERLSRLEWALNRINARTDTLAVWGRDRRIDALIGKWYEREPYYASNRLRLFRRQMLPQSSQSAAETPK